MQLGTIIRAGMYRREPHFNPDGMYDRLVMEVHVDLEQSPPVMTSTEFRLESSRKKKPPLILLQSDCAEVLVTFFSQNSVPVKLPMPAQSPN